jgi:Fe-S cluster biogenesis protein NfuA
MPIDTELEPDELHDRVLQAIELIRPALQSDGGDIVFERLDDDGVVHVTLVGACGTCPVSTQTLKAGVERIIMDRAPGVTAVVDDSIVEDEPFA